MTVSVLFRSHDKAWGVKVTFPKNLNWTRTQFYKRQKGGICIRMGKKPSKIMGNKKK